jgi:hypothetical protein
MLRVIALALGLASAGLLAAPAGAIEPLGGTYDVKFTCKGIAQGVKGSYKFESELHLQALDEDDLRFSIEQLAGGSGYLLTDAKKPANGTLEAVGCNLVPEASYQGVVLHLDVKTKVGSDAASLSGTMILFDRGVNAGNVCKLKARRVNTSPVEIPACEDPT